MSTGKLLLLRHGQSIWNLENLFTGWVDVDLSEQGRLEAQEAGRLLKAEGIAFDIAFTSVLKRAIRTLWIALDEMDMMWLPVERTLAAERAPLRRAAGPQQDADRRKARRGAGEDLAAQLRHPAAAAAADGPGPSALRPPLRGRARGRAARPPNRSRTRWHACCRSGTRASRRNLLAGRNVLVAAHGNSLRAIVKMLDGMSDTDIVELNIPTGVPLLYTLDAQLKPVSSRYLGDAEAVKARAEAVAKQAEKK